MSINTLILTSRDMKSQGLALSQIWKVLALDKK